jgi:hypothetical protein
MDEVKTPTKDEIIIRQSQLQRAIEIFSLLEKKPSVRQICRLSKLLTHFIWLWDENAQELKDFDKWSKAQLKKDLMLGLTVKTPDTNANK